METNDCSIQSTRPRGARPVSYTGLKKEIKFQSTRPRGARQFTDLNTVVNQSSFNPRAHAGRDNHPIILIFFIKCFNPRAHAGRDPPRSVHYIQDKAFQSTRPRGARRLIQCQPCIIIRVSIHAPTRGATQSDTEYLTLYNVSIHAPTRGATRNA